MGDMNIDLLKYKTDTKTNMYLDNIFSHGFLPKISKPTRVTNHSATLIDHLYTNDLTSSYNSGIVLTDLADHFGIFSFCTKPKKIMGTKAKEIRVMSDQNIDNFIVMLQNTSFDNITQCDCVNSAYNLFISKYKSAFNASFPLKTIKANKYYFKHEPWVTNGFLQSLKTKNKLYKQKLKDPSEKNQTKYINYNKTLNKIKKWLKKDHYKGLMETHKFNMKKTWAIMNELLGNDSVKSKLPNFITVNNTSITDKNIIANEFNTFFSEIGYKTGQQVPLSPTHFSEYLPNYVPHTMFVRPVSSSTVINTTLSLKSKSSSGHDDISTKLLKASISSIAEPITHIINLSLTEGKMPKELKIAKVIPVYKSAETTLLNNYRPISLLPAFSKLFEKIIYNKIVQFLEEHDILYRHQYGFRPKHSTIHPMVHFLNHCADNNNISPSKLTLAVFCDLSKAFDVINHEILLHKLDIMGLRGKINEWISDYLTDRKQYVQFDDQRSSLLKIKCGVPQGSILGPLLYLLYVNDIHNSCSSEILSFADDTTLFLSESKIDTLYARANIEINKLFNWFCANRLSLNANKTRYIVIKPPSKNINLGGHSIKINSTVLSRIGNNCKDESIKFLGIHIDESLSWNKHIKSINSKIARALFSIKQVRYILPVQSLRTLYNALIQPHLNYGILAWGSASTYVLKQTINLQKRAIRMISNAKYNSHTDNLFKKNSILKLGDLYELNVTLFMHDFCNNLLPKSFCSTFKYNYEIHNIHTTRQSNLLHIFKCFSKFSSQLPLYIFPKIWNKWSTVCNLSASKSTAKLHLKNKFLSEYSESPYCGQINCHVCS